MDTMTWRRLDRPDLGLLNTFSDLVAHEEWTSRLRLTGTRAGGKLIVASDYGGGHSGTDFQSLSFLVTSHGLLTCWLNAQQIIRQRYLPDARRMSFKKLGDGCRARALLPFLRAANQIPGLLLTILIDKRVGNVFSSDGGDDGTVVAVDIWRPHIREKLCRIAAFGALAIAGMSAPGQDVLWMTDEDDIVASYAHHAAAVRVIGHYLNHMLPHMLGHIRLGTTKCDTGRRDVEDLNALPDLAAGALSEVATWFRDEELPNGMIHRLAGSSDKAQVIAAWLGEGQWPLSRLNALIEPDSSGSLTVRLFHLSASRSPLS